MIFEDENLIRLINKYGLDTVIQLNFDTPEENPITIKSICKIDHFDDDVNEEKHAIMDQKPIEQHNTLQRLVRTN